MVFIPGGSHKQRHERAIRPALSPNLCSARRACRRYGGETCSCGAREHEPLVQSSTGTAWENRVPPPKARSGAGCKEFKRAAQWIPDALNASPGEVFRNLMSQINRLRSYFGMSLLPRLAPTDAEMSLADSSIFLLVFAESALGRH